VTANDKFKIGEKYKWQYALAVVDVAKKWLNIIFGRNQLEATKKPKKRGAYPKSGARCVGRLLME
jgi:hypothetical protein